ncbi:MAG: SDR family oxidoreductase [Bacteroidetes bacterium]|nr:SDR family oxidoreductase [Bacteroidota bacterium]
MKILLTGATGYIGKRILPVLLEEGHEVICCVRNKDRFEWKSDFEGRVSLFKVDFMESPDLENAPLDFDVAYYLIHSLTSSIGGFEDMEATTAKHFLEFVEASSARQIIYMSGIVNSEDLSVHLRSRKRVEEILANGTVPATTLRAGIIVGSGSASFEIIRDLVEKLPVMVAPRWLNSKCQPVAIRDVITALIGVIDHPDCIGQAFDIGCGPIKTYREMLVEYAEVRKLNRWIRTIPVMTPRLSSYWLFFITSTSYPLAVNLVDSMKYDVICADNRLGEMLDIDWIPYKEAVELAFAKIRQNMVVSSWKDSLVSSSSLPSLTEYVEVPKFGCFFDRKERELEPGTEEQVLANIWAIGGDRGWYYGNWMWKLRGYLDKLAGGVGLRRGRTDPVEIHAGDSLDFWRVLAADKKAQRLLLYAEMKLPGDAWLEFSIEKKNGKSILKQVATFRPDGLLGRLYWFSVLPFHLFVFNGMISRIKRFRG